MAPGRTPRSIDELLREARARLRRLEPEAAATAAAAGGLIVDIRSKWQRERQSQ
jgi:hypothetical protein